MSFSRDVSLSATISVSYGIVLCGVGADADALVKVLVGERVRYAKREKRSGYVISTFAR